MDKFVYAWNMCVAQGPYSSIPVADLQNSTSSITFPSTKSRESPSSTLQERLMKKKLDTYIQIRNCLETAFLAM